MLSLDSLNLKDFIIYFFIFFEGIRILQKKNIGINTSVSNMEQKYLFRRKVILNLIFTFEIIRLKKKNGLRIMESKSLS